MTPFSGTRFLFLWVIACAAAEFVGIGLGAVWWVGMDRIDPAPVTVAAKWLILILKSLSGLIEGIVLGGLQALLLRRIYLALPIGAWIMATAALAVLGWGIGSSFAIFSSEAAGAGPPVDYTTGQTIVFAAAFGLMVGALFGAVQALVLRRVANCSIPDDHIDPRRSALFMARSILREVREGVGGC